MSRLRIRAPGAWLLLGVLLGAAPAWAQPRTEVPAEAAPGGRDGEPAGEQGGGPADDRGGEPAGDRGGEPAGDQGGEQAGEAPVAGPTNGQTGEAGGASSAGSRGEPGAPELEVIEDQGMPWSQGVSIDDRRAAREIFREANDLAQGRFFATATTKYKQAIALWPHPAFYYNLFLVQLGVDDPVSAYGSLQKALEYGVEPLDEEKHAEAKQYEALLEEQLARVVIVCDVPGAEVSLDGQRLFTGPGRHEEVMRPGGYHIEATKTGYIADSRDIVLPAGRETRVDLVLTYTASERRWSQWVPWTTIGLGAALAVTGGVFHWQARDGFEEYDSAFDDLCDEEPTMGCERAQEWEGDSLYSIRTQAEEERTRATVAYAAGGAMLAAGVVLLYLNREREVTRQVHGASLETDERDSAVSLMPTFSLKSVGVSALLRF